MGPNYVWALKSLFDLIAEKTGNEAIRHIDIDIDRDMLKIREQYALVQRNNSLTIKVPEIAQEWNFEKNGLLTPDMFSPGSVEKVWWKCSKGHEWQAEIYSRVDGNGCPYCSGRMAVSGETDLATLRPDLVKEWDFDKNRDISPTVCTIGTSKNVWWKCSRGHEWQAPVHDRTGKGNGCPFCSGHRVFSGFNDLQTLKPEIAKEWNYEKNNGLLPSGFTVNSGQKVWWKCPKGHEWASVIAGRTSNKNLGCPYCSGHKVLNGFNDFMTWCHKNNKEQLLKEWDYSRNEISPNQITPKTSKRVWWKCAKGHEWEAIVSNRTRLGRSCPYCAGQKVIPGVNDLLTRYPDLAKEWNYDRNGDLLPSNVMPGSGRKVWWKCANGHEWESSLNDRTSGRGCPICHNKAPASPKT